MRLSEQERSAAQADLDRLTGELVRLYQLREQLKLALSDGESAAEGTTGGLGVASDDLPPIRLVPGKLTEVPLRDDAERQALRARFQVIAGGLS